MLMFPYRSQNLPDGPPGLNWRWAKIFRLFFELPSTFIQTNFDFSESILKSGFYNKNTQGFYLQPMKLSGATTLGCLVVFCDCLCPTSCEYWTSTRAIEVQWKKTFNGFDHCSGWVGSCRFCYKRFSKKGTSGTSKGIFWVTSFNASRKKCTCNTMIRMVLL